MSQTENSKSVASYRNLCIPICSIVEVFVVTENISVECRVNTIGWPTRSQLWKLKTAVGFRVMKA